MKRPRSGSTIKQVAYATRRMNGQASSKKEAALLSGFSMSVAENVKAKVEDTEGYKNAVIVLAHKSNNLLLGIMTEFELRGLKDFSNADLVKALNAITGAWDKIETRRAPNKMQTPQGNPLRGVFQRRVETTTAVIEQVPTEDTAGAQEPIHAEATVLTAPEEDPMDF